MGREGRNLTDLCFLFTTPQMTLGLKPSPQIRPALLIDRSKMPSAMPEPSIHESIAALTQRGTGIVRIWPPLPIRSAITQCSSRCWISSTLNAVSSARRSPQPRRIASVAKSRFPRRLPTSTVRRSRFPCSADSQLPTGIPNRLAPFTRRIPAAKSALKSPQSAASYASLRTAASRKLIVVDA